MKSIWSDGEEQVRLFPVQRTPEVREFCNLLKIRCPIHVPWEMLEQYECHALKNHHQSLEQLADRGGLGPEELLAVINGWSWVEFTERRIPLIEVLDRLRLCVESWESLKAAN